MHHSSSPVGVQKVWARLGDGVRRIERDEERYRQVTNWKQTVLDMRESIAIA